MELILYKKVEKVHGKLPVQIIWVLLEHLNGVKQEVLLEKVEIIMIRKLYSQFLKKVKLIPKEINYIINSKIFR